MQREADAANIKEKKRDETIEQRLMDTERKNWIMKKNSLIQDVKKRKFTMSVREQKVLGYILSKIRQPVGHEPAEPSRTITFEIKQFCKMCGMDYTSGQNYRDIKTTLDRLAENSFWLDYGDGEFKFQWITTPDIQRGNGVIEVEIPKKTMPYLYDMSEQFTSYRLYLILILKSGYSIAMYEWFKSWAYKKEVTVDISALRDYLGLPANKYSDYKEFKKRVLDSSIKEIEEKTDLRVSYTPIRQGRGYTKIMFEINEVDKYTAAEIEDRILRELNMGSCTHE